MAGDDKAEISVAVASDHVDAIDSVVAQLRALGMEIDTSLPELGIITGRIDDSQKEEVERVEGVAHVERIREYQLPPPESEVQ